jgi:hypothetical protein
MEQHIWRSINTRGAMEERTEQRERREKSTAHSKQHLEHNYTIHGPAPLISAHTALEGH